jgi:hypothetical protein
MNKITRTFVRRLLITGQAEPETSYATYTRVGNTLSNSDHFVNLPGFDRKRFCNSSGALALLRAWGYCEEVPDAPGEAAKAAAN